MKKPMDPRIQQLREKLDTVDSLEEFRLYLNQQIEAGPLPDTVELTRQQLQELGNASSKPH